MVVTTEYQKWVLDDLKRYRNIARPVQVSLLRRLLVRRLPLKALHPNGEDEFCSPQIGPNDHIISDYAAAFRHNMQYGEKPIEERLTVTRLSTGGYMLLNGHHRWMAAILVGLKTVPVDIINITTSEDILSALDRSERRYCASFDLDEVLLADTSAAQTKPPLPFSLFAVPPLRTNAQFMLNELQRLGFDVWVYSSRSRDEVQRILSGRHVKPDGIISIIRDKKVNSSVHSAFRQKYDLIAHIDNEGIVGIDSHSHDYDTIAVSGDDCWADNVFAKLRALTAQRQAAK